MEQIQLKVDSSIATISICRPEAMNALSRSIVDELERLLERVEENPDVRVLLLHSKGHFAAGADIAEMVECTPDEAAAFLFTPVYNRLEQLKIPTVAAIEGYALGGGMELALCCDFRLAKEDAKIGFPETGLGIMPGAGGTVRLPKLIGYENAANLIFTGRIVKSQEALALGLVGRVYGEDFEEQLQRFATQLAARSKSALAAAKSSMQQGVGKPVFMAVEQEAKIWSRLFDTPDQKEGMRAFLEKRRPNFE